MKRKIIKILPKYSKCDFCIHCVYNMCTIQLTPNQKLRLIACGEAIKILKEVLNKQQNEKV